jgi:hypothetical protein
VNGKPTRTRRQKYPIHIKTQSSSWIETSGQGGKRFYARWIAVALNKEDAAQLLSEPHLNGFVIGGQGFCGCAAPQMDENIFCVHPYEQVRSDL